MIVVAALASIATSRKKWRLDADLTRDDPSKARLVTIEASQQPEVGLDPISSGVALQPHDGGTTWPGTVRYLLPAGASLERVMVTGVCGGGACSSDCTIPSDQFVKLTSSTPVETWKLEIKHEPQTTTLEPGTYAVHGIRIEATHRARIRVDTDGLVPTVSGYGGAFHVSWPQVTTTTKVTWTPRIEIEGLCATPGPCTPPPDAKVAVTAITVDRY